jgi:hypothetical protein
MICIDDDFDEDIIPTKDGDGVRSKFKPIQIDNQSSLNPSSLDVDYQSE